MSIDKDCKLSRKSSHHSTVGQEEAVNQITADLMSVEAFQYKQGRQGHASFPNFTSKIFNVDYRDLHDWMKDLIEKWGSIYQNA